MVAKCLVMRPSRSTRRSVKAESGTLSAKCSPPNLLGCFDRVDLTVIVHDEMGIIQLANQAAANLAGVTLDELIGTPVSQLVSPVKLVEGDVADLANGKIRGIHCDPHGHASSWRPDFGVHSYLRHRG